MNFSSLALALFGTGILAAGSAHALQKVDIQNVTRNGAAVTQPLFVAAGDAIKFDAVLTNNGAGLTTGLSLCLEYKRTVTGDPTLRNLFDNGTKQPDGTPEPVATCHRANTAVAGSVQVPGSDTAVLVAWVGLRGDWPPSASIPLKLYDAQFNVAATPSGSSAVGFAASSVAGGETFATNGPLQLCGKPTVTLNTIANGVEAGSIAATIAVTLSAAVPAACSLNGSFPVTLNLSGTATTPGGQNADYSVGGNAISANGAIVTATFPTDGSTKSLTFIATPISDNVAEGTETLTLTVAAGSGNYLGVGQSASATISDVVAATGTVVEYLDTEDFPGSPGGHYFYSSDPAEQAAVDAGAAGKFSRTGRTFKTGGSSPVCRFYGSITPGPNSHFFTVSPEECNALKSLQKTPTPAAAQQWNYERIEYNTTPPVAAGGQLSCPPSTVPLYRAYNNAFTAAGAKNPWDSNHRFTPNRADIDAMVRDFGWRDEGLQFCTPL